MALPNAAEITKDADQLHRRPRWCARRLELGHILLWIFEKQRDLTLQLLKQGSSGRGPFDRILRFADTGQRRRPDFGRGIGIRRQNHQPLGDLGLHNTREIPLR
jgi:hypothetical protein